MYEQVTVEGVPESEQGVKLTVPVTDVKAPEAIVPVPLEAVHVRLLPTPGCLVTVSVPGPPSALKDVPPSLVYVVAPAVEDIANSDASAVTSTTMRENLLMSYYS